MERVRYPGQLAVSPSDRHVEQQYTRDPRQGLSSRATRGTTYTQLQQALAGSCKKPSESVLQLRLSSGTAFDRRLRDRLAEESGVDASRYLR